MHSYDAVPAPSGGVIEKYMPTLNQYMLNTVQGLLWPRQTKTLKQWNTRNQLETRAHWSEMKAEWEAEYEKYLDNNKDF